MLVADLVGYSTAAATLGLTVFLAWQYRQFRLHPWAFLLAVTHPGWWLSAQIGDCGVLLVVGCAVYLMPTTAISIIALLRARRSA
jgi:hypothetical protein